MTRIAAEDLNAAEDPNAAEDLTAVVDPNAVVVHIGAAPWAILLVLNVVPNLVLIAAVVQLVAAPWVILSVQKRVHAAVRIWAPTVVQPLAGAHSVVQFVAAEFRCQRGFFPAFPLPQASLA